MKHALYILSLFAVACFSGGCIEIYNPDVGGHVDNLLVVEGFITDGETTIWLSKTIALNSNEPFQRISGAQVRIEGENGESFTALDMGAGRYVATEVELNDETRYRLHIVSVDGEYLSEYRPPQQTPPIAGIDVYQESPGDLVQVRINVIGEPDGPIHYYWSYDEVWEMKANMPASYYFGAYEGDYGPDGIGYSYEEFLQDNLGYFIYPQGHSPYYYCWKYESSNELLVGSTSRLTENSLRNHILYEIDPGSDRLSLMYRTTITQYALAEDAYRYYTNQKINADETGSIFAPVPSELPGNIVCVSSPETPVIGFVEVSRRVTREHDQTTIYYQPPINDCQILNSTMDGGRIEEVGARQFYPLFWNISPLGPPQGDGDLTTRRCFDCRIGGGTKNRPDRWPTQNY